MIDADLFLVIGLIVAALSVPAVISAFSESRTPLAAIVLISVGGGLILYAVMQKPGGYSLGEVPTVFADVIRDLLR